jgi:hypothetical protein
LLTKIFGPKRDEGTGDGRKLKNEKVCELYCLPDIDVIESGRIRLGGGVLACVRERRGAYVVLVVKPEGTRPLGRPRRRCEDNIKVDLRSIGRAWTRLI